MSAGRIVDVETKSQACAMGGVVYLRARRGCMLHCDKEVRGVPTYMYLASIDPKSALSSSRACAPSIDVLDDVTRLHP